MDRPVDALQATIDRLEQLRFLADVAFAPDGRSVLATVRPDSEDPEGTRRRRIFRFPLDGAAEKITHGPTGEEHASYSPDGSAIAFLSDRLTRHRADLFVIEGGNEARPAAAMPGYVEDYAWLADSSGWVALVADRGVNGGAINGAMRLSWGDEDDPEVTRPDGARRRLFRIRRDGGAEEVGPDAYNIWEFVLAGDGTALAVASQDASERGWHRPELIEVDLASRKAKAIYKPKWQIQGLASSPDGKYAAFTEGWSSDRGLVAGEIRLIELKTGAVRSVAAEVLSNVTWLIWRDPSSVWFAGWHELGSTHGVVGIDGEIDWQQVDTEVIGESAFVSRITPSPDGESLVAVRDAVGSPPELVRKRAGPGEWEPLSHLNDEIAAGFPAYPDIRTIDYEGAGGLALRGVLVLPTGRGPGPLPMIVDIHGGPCYASKPQFNPSGALTLAAAGYAVLLPNYRGNVGWGQAFTRLNIGDPAGAEFEDILRAIDAVIDAGFADPDRLGVTGASYGGYLTGWAVATTHRFKAAVMVAGISDQLSCHYSCEHAFHDFINGGPLAEKQYRDVAVDRSPITRLDRPVTPTLMLHGRDDRCTPLGQAQEFYAALLERGVEAELVVYPHAGHGLRKREHRADALRRKLDWFGRHMENAA